ncbi:MAG: carboxypeptidase regulatory-like domain-containing protein [Candidatus Marinimicrobia bacterium]|nr:carboxypeptidase regulatory-like domain-containing protein [Candidatus Neomarinimicrobiota bacterium]
MINSVGRLHLFVCCSFKIITIATFTILLIAKSRPQTSVIVKGKVLDSYSKIGIQGAKVSFINEYKDTFSTYSDNEGNYTINFSIIEIGDKKGQNTLLGYKLYQNYPDPFIPWM